MSWLESSSINISSSLIDSSTGTSKTGSSSTTDSASAGVSTICSEGSASKTGSSVTASSEISKSAVSSTLTAAGVAVKSSSASVLSVASLNAALFIILFNSSHERAIVSSPSSAPKNPASSFVSSKTISSSTGASSTGAVDGAGDASAFLISSRFCFNLLISSFNPDKSATICCNREFSTTVEFSGITALGSSFSSCFGVSALISFTTGAADVFSSPTDKS